MGRSAGGMVARGVGRPIRRARAPVSPAGVLQVVPCEVHKGCRYEVLRMDAVGAPRKETARKGTVVVVPGNPGAITFYRDFMERLHRRMGGGVSVVGVGYLGHGRSEGLTPFGRTFDLEEQEQHVARFLEAEARRTGRPVHAVGHSIGCHLILHALNVVDDSLGQVEMLMPFIYLNKRDRTQRRIHRLIRLPLLKLAVAALAGVVRLLPPSAQLAVMRSHAKGMGENGLRELCPTMLRFGAVFNFLVLGSHEFACFKRRDEEDRKLGGCGEALLNWGVLKALGKAGRVGLSYVRDDHWAPLWQAEDITTRTDLSYDVVAGVSHDFVTKLDESIMVADHLFDARRLHD